MISNRHKANERVERVAKTSTPDSTELCTDWPFCADSDAPKWSARLHYACVRLKEISNGAITDVDCWGVSYAGVRLSSLEVYGKMYWRSDITDAYNLVLRACAQLFLLAEELLCEYVHGYSAGPGDGPDSVQDMECQLRTLADHIKNSR